MIVAKKRIIKPVADFWKENSWRITETKNRGGRPCIRDTGLHITIILYKLYGGMGVTEIVKEYPSITKEDVMAAIIYAAKIMDTGVGVKKYGWVHRKLKS